MRVARAVVLNPEQKEALTRIARARSRSVRMVERARIVLLADAGMQDKEIASELGITAHKASRWRNRFLDLGMAGLEKDAPRLQAQRHGDTIRGSEYLRWQSHQPVPGASPPSGMAAFPALG